MKAGDVSGGHGYSRESWLSARLGDPNAALWASITPPAQPNLATIVRRRAAKFSLDLLAQRLYLLLPAFFSSRAAARIVILSASVAAGAALGVVGYLSLFRRAPTPIAAAPARVQTAQHSLARHSAADSARNGQTELSAAARASASASAPTLAATAPRSDTDRIAQPLPPSADAAAPSHLEPAKAKRKATKKRSKFSARRGSKRRARAAND